VLLRCIVIASKIAAILVQSAKTLEIANIIMVESYAITQYLDNEI
jgi:hypothetical protein